MIVTKTLKLCLILQGNIVFIETIAAINKPNKKSLLKKNESNSKKAIASLSPPFQQLQSKKYDINILSNDNS